MDLTRRPLHPLPVQQEGFFDKKTAAAADEPPKRKPWKPGMLAPGDAAHTPKAELGQRSHAQKQERTGHRLVTFISPSGHHVHHSVESSTDKQAVDAARKKGRIPPHWKVHSVGPHKPQ